MIKLDTIKTQIQVTKEDNTSKIHIVFTYIHYDIYAIFTENTTECTISWAMEALMHLMQIVISPNE